MIRGGRVDCIWCSRKVPGNTGEGWLKRVSFSGKLFITTSGLLFTTISGGDVQMLICGSSSSSLSGREQVSMSSEENLFAVGIVGNSGWLLDLSRGFLGVSHTGKFDFTSNVEDATSGEIDAFSAGDALWRRISMFFLSVKPRFHQIAISSIAIIKR